MGYSLSSQIEFVEATIEHERGSGIESMYREIHESLTFRLREIEAAVDTPIPTCAGCGKQPEPSTPLPGGKPSHWFARTRDGHTEYACTRDCIPRNEMVMPW